MIGDMLCPGGIKPPDFPNMLCVDIMEVLSGVLGGI
jgi:hypothetical protein